MPYLLTLLKTDDQPERLRRRFVFLERMAQHEGDRIENVLAVSVCEDIGGEGPAILATARKYLGSATRDLCHLTVVQMGHKPAYEDDPPEINALEEWHRALFEQY